MPMSHNTLTSELKDIFKDIETHLDEHILTLRKLVQQPSVSAQSLGTRACAEMLAASLRDLGCTHVELVDTSGEPLVYAELDSGAPHTLLIYHMYDVQPAEEAGWSVEPFAGAVIQHEQFGRCLVARGAKNSKGPLQAFLNAVESIIRVRQALPVNLVFVIEGEEELGSPHLDEFAIRYESRLRKADAVLFPYAMQECDGRAILWPGTKGLVYLEIECSGQRWTRGPRKFSLHSSYKAIIDSPAWRLVHALSSLTSEDGNTVQIDGFYDAVRAPTAAEEHLVTSLVGRFREEAFRQLWHVDHFVHDLHGLELLRRYFFSPTLNIDGLDAGYTGPGSKTVLPHRAVAKLDVRLVPDQEPNTILELLARHFRTLGYDDLEIRKLASNPWAQTDADAPIVQSVAQAIRHLGMDPEIWPRNVGFFPAYVFNRAPLHLPFCVGGLGHGGRAHGPDEYFVLDGNARIRGLAGCEQSFAAMLFAYRDLMTEDAGRH
jgi:acetylornithine deacetylase/succinyl-diaminopimelate desuccinylase-like protein